jgi:archaellum biogenesis ATPase FlaH
LGRNALAQLELKPGTLYIFQDKKADRALGLYNLMKSKVNEVLVVTRLHPDRVNEDFNIPASSVFWLSNSAGPRNINPQNIGILTDTLIRTYEKGGTAVIFEGIEYLMLQNDFSKVLKLMSYLYESVAVNHGILIITLDPEAFNTKEFALLTKDAELVGETESVII